MSPKTQNSTNAMVAIEVRHDSLVMVSFEPAADEQFGRVYTRSIRWRHEANSLRSEQGRLELLNALKTLADEEGLAGTTVSFTLSGEYSICRVVIGNSDQVRQELTALEERKDLYLLLGPEEKISARSVQELDARHQHAVFAVANTKTVDILLQAAGAAGLEVGVVEPALVALCRLLGATGQDADGPALIADLSDNGVKLGISCRGQLLLDYRPVGSTVHEVDGVFLPTLARLQRYCDRNYRYVRGSLTRIFLCGSQEPAASAISLVREQKQLTVKVLAPTEIDSRWELVGAEAGGEYCAALGTCLRLSAPNPGAAGPNLIERRNTTVQRSLFVESCRAFWPVAAVLLIALGMFAAAWHERLKCHRLERSIHVVEASAAELRRTREEITEAETKAAYLRRIADQSAVPPWGETLAAVARCMPEDIWLEKVTVNDGGKVALTGNSYSEAMIYQFGNHLESSSHWSYVTVEGTWPASSRMGRTTKFDIQCEFNGQVNEEEEEAGSD